MNEDAKKCSEAKGTKHFTNTHLLFKNLSLENVTLAPKKTISIRMLMKNHLKEYKNQLICQFLFLGILERK